jgi:hypothetical protein
MKSEVEIDLAKCKVNGEVFDLNPKGFATAPKGGLIDA